MPSLASLPSFYDTYRARTAENEQAGMRDLQQIGALVQLQNTMKAQQDDQQLKSMLAQSGGNVEAVVQGALRAGRPDIAAKLAPLIEAQRRAVPQAQPIGAGGLLRPDGSIVPPQARPADPNAAPKAPPQRQRYDGTNVVQEELQPDGTWKTVGQGPRFAPEKPAAEKTYPIVHTAEGIFERRPEGLVPLLDPKTKKPLNPTVRERPITEYQGKNAMFGNRASMAHDVLMKYEDKINVAGLAAKRAIQDTPVVGGLLGAGANIALSKEQQQVEQAQRNFVNAVLRQESGAVINPSEFENAIKQYFPQPGDKKEVIEQKRKNRLAVIAGFKKIAGSAWEDERSISPASGGWSIEPAP